jgi:NADPH-dependent 2,4-dienoyl-CoA reductase/sulfur reductase-like enzyme
MLDLFVPRSPAGALDNMERCSASFATISLQSQHSPRRRIMPFSFIDNYPGAQHDAVPVPRVAIVGAGFVGATTAYALLMSGTVAEIILIDQNAPKATPMI